MKTRTPLGASRCFFRKPPKSSQNPRILRRVWIWGVFCFSVIASLALHRVAIHTHQTTTTQSQKWILAQKLKATPMILPTHRAKP
ncbi:hypothetical protein [Helicobacter zhangjianzhongii]|uniref:hypothetical protein n=1 Tax=Helicobacter zhangjianzhongii TaxID=2974574 RepID=UPI00255722BD|nr:hypothetical protein [Helicobacter sp. CPD2-1]MDL0080490.1 hypothetical protein [Helicobacter sp. CPD2-1]